MYLTPVCLCVTLLSLPLGQAQGDACGSSSLADYSTRNPHCTVSSDCLGVVCSDIPGGVTASVSLRNCQDPVGIDLTIVSPSEVCEQTFYVGGSGVHVDNNRTVGGNLGRFMASYDRNTSHLQFRVSFCLV